MKTITAILAIALTSCASLTPQQQSSLTTGILDTAIGLASAKEGLPPTDAALLKTVSDNLASSAMGAQANVGSTAAQANLSSFSASPAVGTAVVQAIGPNTVITQNAVDAIYAAAGRAK